MERGKFLTMYTSDRGLVSKVYRELKQLSIKKTQLKMGHGSKESILKRGSANVVREMQTKTTCEMFLSYRNTFNQLPWCNINLGREFISSESWKANTKKDGIFLVQKCLHYVLKLHL